MNRKCRKSRACANELQSWNEKLKTNIIWWHWHVVRCTRWQPRNDKFLRRTRFKLWDVFEFHHLPPCGNFFGVVKKKIASRKNNHVLCEEKINTAPGRWRYCWRRCKCLTEKIDIKVVGSRDRHTRRDPSSRVYRVNQKSLSLSSV